MYYSMNLTCKITKTSDQGWFNSMVKHFHMILLVVEDENGEKKESEESLPKFTFQLRLCYSRVSNFWKLFKLMALGPILTGTAQGSAGLDRQRVWIHAILTELSLSHQCIFKYQSLLWLNIGSNS